MNRVPAHTLVFLLVVTISGCLGSGDDAPGMDASDGGLAIAYEWAEHAFPNDEAHDHMDTAHHVGLSTPNFETLGWHPLGTEYYSTSAGGTLCGDATDVDERRLAVVHSFTSDVAFVLVDVTDPAAPVKLGEMVMPTVGSRDVALTLDGRHVVVASTGAKQPERLPAALALDGDGPHRAYWKTPCSPHPVPIPDAAGVRESDYVPYPPGAILVNIEDPAAPVVTSAFAAPPLGGHSITAGSVGETQIAILSVINVAEPANPWWFLGIEDTPLGHAEFVPYSSWVELPTPEAIPLVNGHTDGWIKQHPGTGQHIAYLAAWHNGVVMLDISNPRLPTKIGEWTDSSGVVTDLVQDGPGNVHSIHPLPELWDDRHYTVIGQEIVGRPSDTPSGWVRVLDTTDPTKPTKVADWTLPVEVEWGGSAMFSTHYLSVHEKTAFVSMYHGGVWAIDLSDLSQSMLPAIGVFVPANEPPEPPAEHEAYSWTPTTMEALALDNGDVVVFDSWSGVYVVRFDAESPAPPRTWPV